MKTPSRLEETKNELIMESPWYQGDSPQNPLFTGVWITPSYRICYRIIGSGVAQEIGKILDDAYSSRTAKFWPEKHFGTHSNSTRNKLFSISVIMLVHTCFIFIVCACQYVNTYADSHCFS